ncbi:MAG: hypothetical protein M3Z66_20430 [Chloroflexota bacterium]|nr:hypothetical protein [Chloroflexota bacterium]
MNVQPSPPSSHSIDDLWGLLQEQSERLGRLEARRADGQAASTVPLPPAQDRAVIGRPAVIGAGKKVRHPARSTTVSAAEAFQALAPITAQYASVPIMEGFNWADCATQLKAGQWYLVVFRSVRRQAVEDLILEMHDYGAHIEAQRRAIGLLYYFRGTYNEQRECLSFCIWRSRQEAVRAAQLPLHRVAMTLVDEKYEWYALERYTLRKVRGRSGIEAECIG